MSVHPMTSSVLVAAGDKWGAIGLWNVNDTTSETHGVQVFYVSCPNLLSWKVIWTKDISDLFTMLNQQVYS